MRALFLTGGGTGPVNALAPFASAFRSDGHQVLVGCHEENVNQICDLGLPAAVTTSQGLFEVMFTDRNGNKLGRPQGPQAELEFSSRAFGRMAAAAYPTACQLAEAWRPDVVVGGTRNYVAALVARRFDIPYVCHAWDGIERIPSDLTYAADEISDLLEELDVNQIPQEAMFIQTTHPTVRPADAEPARYMRWAPGNGQTPAEPWMLGTEDGRPRICLTSGSRAAQIPDLGEAFFDRLVGAPAFAEAELVICAPNPLAEQLQEKYSGHQGGIRAGWFPLDVVLPSCDLVAHHAGGVTAATAKWAGLPQLVLADMEASADPCRRVDDFGASITTVLSESTPQWVNDASERMLANRDTFAAKARELADLGASLPRPTEVIDLIEKL
ncbi:hypothetical protein CGZ98_03605 [Enemella evansiae]|uniref:glycosyltransferase n=1 Tax=Enemella evansiae TaxID=2016499 RepID=UPI000B97AE6A|nr:nucleotide disphospho-sugar-binding domain-containing protein [Enemella evansiae]OYO15505.1 hypothetical protein CGZ98_03605 [Enemella evansiae]